ncbi:pilus assembly FimT family protein [Agathobacter sp. LCP21S3_B2]|uniref:pilus assembly FimT family protein n=1 Tax=Agathobacter sp. LCP21S3_B2 TaxID=3438734 RepID=UPI003F8EC421
MKKTAYDKKNNNKNGGFSLVELIVVIAIMAVLTGIASMSLASVMGVSVKQCARDIQSAANQTRVSTLGKDEVIMTITKGNKAKSSEAYYCTIVTKDGLGKTIENEEKIGKSNLGITYVLSDSKGNKTSDITLDDTHSLTIKFNRGTGAMAPCMKSDGSSGGDYYCMQIKVKKNSTEKIISFYPETGKVSLN